MMLWLLGYYWQQQLAYNANPNLKKSIESFHAENKLFVTQINRFDKQSFLDFAAYTWIGIYCG